MDGVCAGHSDGVQSSKKWLRHFFDIQNAPFAKLFLQMARLSYSSYTALLPPMKGRRLYAITRLA